MCVYRSRGNCRTGPVRSREQGPSPTHIDAALMVLITVLLLALFFNFMTISLSQLFRIRVLTLERASTTSLLSVSPTVAGGRCNRVSRG
jgi:hypothetical protein